MAVLRLGNADKAGLPNDLGTFFNMFHSSMSAALRKKKEFRDESNAKWRPLQALDGESVTELQKFLKDAGFMLRGKVDGIFGYHTLAGVRLFQEYVRTVEPNEALEGMDEIGVPDGVVGKKTQAHIDRWRTDNLKADWGQHSSQNPSDEFTMWIELLRKAQEHFLENSNPILDAVNDNSRKSDTFKVKDWKFEASDVHLIGIRRGQDEEITKRENDDIFILLINGLVFKFWGSTDPSQSMASRKDEPFLVEGQHKYRLGWHKVSDEAKVYKALRPYSNGVLVFRDKNNDNSLSEVDIKHGLQEPNHVINIHWSGDGQFNFSAGCQVIAGRSYMNHLGEVIDCSAHAAAKYGELGSKKTRAAYNVIADLILSYTPPTLDYVLYTLGRDETLTIDDSLGENFVELTFNKLQGNLEDEV